MKLQEEARRIFQTLQDAGYPWLVDVYLDKDEEGRFIALETRHLGQSQQTIGTRTPHGHRVKHLYRPTSS
jgi:hypothetical protein